MRKHKIYDMMIPLQGGDGMKRALWFLIVALFMALLAIIEIIITISWALNLSKQSSLDSDMVKNNNVPIGLVGGKSYAKRDIKNGSFLTYDDIQLDEETTVYRLRKLQDQTFAK